MFADPKAVVDYLLWMNFTLDLIISMTQIRVKDRVCIDESISASLYTKSSPFNR